MSLFVYLNNIYVSSSYFLWLLGRLNFVIHIHFKEENDEEYEEEGEVADVFDSDFDEDVSKSVLI